MKIIYEKNTIVIKESFLSFIFLKIFLVVACFVLLLISKISNIGFISSCIFSAFAIIIGFVCPRKKFIINQEGIKIKDFKSKSFSWSNIKYISMESIEQKNTKEKLEKMSSNEIKNMDGQEYEELEAKAYSKYQDGIYIGILKDGYVDEEVILCSKKMKADLYDRIIKFYESKNNFI